MYATEKKYCSILDILLVTIDKKWYVTVLSPVALLYFISATMFSKNHFYYSPSSSERLFLEMFYFSHLYSTLTLIKISIYS